MDTDDAGDGYRINVDTSLGTIGTSVDNINAIQCTLRNIYTTIIDDYTYTTDKCSAESKHSVICILQRTYYYSRWNDIGGISKME